MGYVNRLLVSIYWTSEIYDLIFIFVNWLTKMVYYGPVKITIDTPSLLNVIIKAIVLYHNQLDLIVPDQGSVFTSMFWFLYYYFLGIKRKLFIIFYPQINGQTERQKSIIETYF